jgi:SAM-dependent methyltransferase
LGAVSVSGVAVCYEESPLSATPAGRRLAIAPECAVLEVGCCALDYGRTISMDCCTRQSIEHQFNRKDVEASLRRFRRRGPDTSTRLLIAALQSAGAIGDRLLDIGGGVGAIHHALLDSGVREAVEVDISPASIAAADAETRRRGHADRVRFVQGDFVDVAATLDSADVVTIDRVICCYPDMERLVSTSAAKATRLYGAVYPRDRWWVRMVMAGINGWQRIRRSDFRVYLHSPRAIARVLIDQGLVPRSTQHTLVWEVAVFSRAAAPV